MAIVGAFGADETITRGPSPDQPSLSSGQRDCRTSRTLADHYSHHPDPPRYRLPGQARRWATWRGSSK